MIKKEESSCNNVVQRIYAAFTQRICVWRVRMRQQQQQDKSVSFSTPQLSANQSIQSLLHAQGCTNTHTCTSEPTREVMCERTMWHSVTCAAEVRWVSTLSLSSSAFRLSVRTYSKHVKMPPHHHHQSLRQIKRAGQGGCFTAADINKDEAFPLTWRLASTAASLTWRLKNNMSAPQCPVPPPHSPPPPGKQNNKAGDDADKDYLGMEKPTHLLYHHTVCTVILNRDQRETTGD